MTLGPIQTLLCELGISSEDSFEIFHKGTRDQKDVDVIKCKRSGVLSLSRIDHINKDYYTGKDKFSYWEFADWKTAKNLTLEDDQRRAEQFENQIINKDWLDIGTGTGGIFDLLKNKAKSCSAVEPQSGPREEIIRNGISGYESIAAAKDNSYDVATLFHVLEHFSSPIEELKTISKKLRPGGKVIIEVPHAKDILVSLFNNESFKDFTFWGEHLILHTRDSIRTFLETAGFKNIHIKGFQRYPLANHLHWLSEQKPGGHIKWEALRDGNLDDSYAKLLSQLDSTDTLLAYAETPNAE